jgi:hypothetical protein
MIWSALGRLILVPVAFVLAACVSLAIVVTLGLEKITHAMHGTEAGPETIEAYSDLAFKGWDLVTSLTIVPVLAVVIVGEVARIRSWLYYMVGGGLGLAVMPLISRFEQGGLENMPPAAVWQVLATAGFAGGLVYWLVAGRRA